MKDARFHAIVSGEVHMVGFRAFAQWHADQLGVRGWVRNLPGGEVEVVAEGKREALDSLLSLLREGPTLARVSGVEVRWEEPSGEPKDFRVRY
jgi:acylphosphatase